jgi:hypothetical protein
MQLLSLVVPVILECVALLSAMVRLAEAGAIKGSMRYASITCKMRSIISVLGALSLQLGTSFPFSLAYRGDLLL